MGFALWIDGEQAWAQGTHEYKPMGVAVISASDLFRARDFRTRRYNPSRRAESFAGLYPSLEAVNRRLRSHTSKKSPNPANSQ